MLSPQPTPRRQRGVPVSKNRYPRSVFRIRSLVLVNDHMRDTQLIYASRSFGYDDLTLTSILMQARENNARDGITGCLICREDLFLQLLEGPRVFVTSTFARILRDERHVDVVSLLSSEIDRRLFPDWFMRHDPARSWMWTPEEVATGVVGRASDQEIRGIFERLAKEPASAAAL